LVLGKEEPVKEEDIGLLIASGVLEGSDGSSLGEMIIWNP
jgi:hypothetical protein